MTADELIRAVRDAIDRTEQMALRAAAADRKLLHEYVETHSYYLAHPDSPYGPVVGLRTAVESMAARYGLTTEEASDGG